MKFIIIQKKIYKKQIYLKAHNINIRKIIKNNKIYNRYNL